MRKQSNSGWLAKPVVCGWLVVIALLGAGCQPVRPHTGDAGPWPMTLQPVAHAVAGESSEQAEAREHEAETGPNRLGASAEAEETLAEGVRFETGKEDDPLERARWYWEQRIYPTGQLQFQTYQNALDAEISSVGTAAPDAPRWVELGPKPLKDITFGGQSTHDASGRTLTVALHPTLAGTLLVGTAQGGIWRSVDGGSTYSAVADNMPSLAIKVIRFALSDPSIVYAGTGEPHGSTSIFGQGVLKSTNGGQSWQSLPNHGAGWDFRGVSISGLQVHPANPNTLYVTTAAVSVPLDYFNPADVPVTGIFKSVNGGQSWQLLKKSNQYTVPYSYLDKNHGFMDLEMFRSNADVLYATELFGGVYRTVNGGASWTLMTPRKNTVVPVGDPNMGATFPAPVADWTYFDPGSSKFILTNVELFDNTLPDFDRIEISLAQSGGAINPQNPNTYVLYAGYSTSDVGLNLPDLGGADGAGLVFKSTDGGATWRWLGDWGRGGAPNYCASQCSYDNTVEVNPQNPNDVVVGGNANYNSPWPVPTNHISNPPIKRYQELPWRGQVHRSLDGGQSWIDITPGCRTVTQNVGTWNGKPLDKCTQVASDRVIHPDVHGLTFAAGNRILAATDGGLYRVTVSSDGTNPSHYLWQNLNQGLSTLQFFDFGLHPTNSSIILGGMQDNANGYWNGQNWEGWGFGDGTLGLFDPKAPQHVYMGTQFSVHRHDDGGAKVALDANGNPANGWHLTVWPPDDVAANDSVPFLPVFAINPVTPTVVYAASNTGLYRSGNRGDTWSERLNGEPLSGRPTVIAISPLQPLWVYVGTSTGALYRFDFLTQNYFEISAGLPNRYITRILASALSSKTLYVAFSGYDQNTPATPGKLFKSTNLGQTWTNLSGNLPDVPVSALAIDPTNEDRIWVGTDVGVFQTQLGGNTWASFRLNMPVVAIMDMEYNRATHSLVVSTHGRGVWRYADFVSAGYLPLIRK